MPDTKPLTADQERELREALQRGRSFGSVILAADLMPAALATIDALRADNKDLQGINYGIGQDLVVRGKGIRSLKAERDTLAAENARLRERLEALTNAVKEHLYDPHCGDTVSRDRLVKAAHATKEKA